MKIFLKKPEANVQIPQYVAKGDAGMDLRAIEDIIIPPGETVIIKTGLYMAIPEGYEVQIRPRSGTSFKTRLRIANSPGTIDAGYRGEFGIIVTNTSKDYFWDEDGKIMKIPDTHLLNVNGCVENPSDPLESKDGYYIIKKGDRIAQMVLCKFDQVEFEIVDDVSEIGTSRGGGFGSTGTN